VICLATTALTLVHAGAAFAWKAGAHWALAQSAAQQLPAHNPVRAAMLAYPNDLAWGSNGPDLPYMDPLVAIKNTPWADAYHYDLPGSA